MKKVLTLAAILIAAISANAQHVNPINFELTKFQLDSLRAKYVNGAEARETIRKKSCYLRQSSGQ